jgi:hypothetical protein
MSRLHIPSLLSLFALLTNLAGLRLPILDCSGNHALNDALWTFAETNRQNYDQIYPLYEWDCSNILECT